MGTITVTKKNGKKLSYGVKGNGKAGPKVKKTIEELANGLLEKAIKEKEEKETKVVEKKTVGVDAWGSRFGTRVHAVNEQIRKHGPISMKKIRVAIDSDDTYYNHIKKMTAAGHVVKVNGGYCTPEQAKALAKGKKKVKKSKKVG